MSNTTPPSTNPQPTPNRFPLPAYLLLKLPALSGPAAKLYLLLAAIASPDGLITRTAASFATRAGLSRRHVFRCLAQLESAGLLRRLPRPHPQAPSHLLLLTPRVVVSPPSQPPATLATLNALRTTIYAALGRTPAVPPQSPPKPFIPSVPPVTTPAQPCPPSPSMPNCSPP